MFHARKAWIVQEAVIRELWVYPVKGCQGVAVDEIDVSRRGIPGDRDFVLWHDGELVDQKETPRIASLAAQFDAPTGTLTFRHADAGEFVHRVRSEGESRAARWVLDEFETIDQGDAVATWLSAAIDKKVRLVTPGEPWRINFPIPQMELLHGEEKQSFFAASPVSLASIESLADLNAKLATPVPMDRFRMNVVVYGLPAYREDELATLTNGAVCLEQVMAAERCEIVATDQKTGERNKSDLLKRMRQKPKEDRIGSGRTFGSYLQVRSPGTLRVGDRLQAQSVQS
jgi:uncharacterized protein YcbX